jgi:hypothetical protein
MSEQLKNIGLIAEGVDAAENAVEIPEWLDAGQREMLDVLDDESKKAQIAEWEQERAEQHTLGADIIADPKQYVEDTHEQEEKLMKEMSEEQSSYEEVPESGLMSLEELEIELDKITDAELLKENHFTREAARQEYEKMLSNEPIGSPRRETIKEYLREQEKAIDMIAARKEALLKPKGFLKRWFGRRT